MKAQRLHRVTDLNVEQMPLVLEDVPEPQPDRNEIKLQVSCCGICHTDMDEIEGRTPPSSLPMILGHQIVGHVVECGPDANRFEIGERLGIAWIHSACGHCEACMKGNENLCPEFNATGRDAPGGYAEYTVVNQSFAYRIPEIFSDSEAAPMLCAGAIGYRSLNLCRIQNGDRLGLTGFGSSARQVVDLVKFLYPDSEIYVFARSLQEREIAIQSGVLWAGNTEQRSPKLLHAIIDTTPAWKPVVEALANLLPAGRLVINAIRKESNDQDYLTSLDYPQHLWLEKEIKSVANVTRTDVEGFLQTAAGIPIRPQIECYSLANANRALLALKHQPVSAAKVLTMQNL